MNGGPGGPAKGRSRRVWVVAAVAAGALWVGLATAFVLRLDGRAQDDHYITYRYALNLARGDGLVYNPGERVFGLSEPGLALALAALHAAAGVDIPQASTILYAAALVALALVLLGEAWSRGPTARAGALLGGTLLLASSFVWTSHGSAGVAVLAVLALAARTAGRRPGVAGALAGAAAWLRPDALAGAGLLGLLLAVESRRLPRRYALAAAGLVLAGLLAAWAWFGIPLPETVGAKRADALGLAGDAWGAARAFWGRAAALAPRHFGRTWPWLFAVGLAGLVPFWRSGGRAARLLVLYGAAVAATYTALGVPLFSWYLLPVATALLYGVGFAVAAVGRGLGTLLAAAAAGGRRSLPGAATAAAGLLLALLAAAPLLVPFGRAVWLWQASFAGYGHLDTYRRAAVWLREETAPGAAVAYVEIGVLGYGSGRRLVDLMGLVTREARPYVRSRDVEGGFLALPTDLVISHTRGRMGPLISQRWFRRAYRPVAHFADPTGDGRLTIYRRRRWATLPPPHPPRPPRPQQQPAPIAQ